MKRYKVLWIDDDFNKDFDRLAYQNGLELVHFKTSREGMFSIEANLKTYDAVILDGLAYNETENEEHSIDGLINSLNKITELRLIKWFPVFVFTGELNKIEYQRDLKWIERFDVPIIIKGVDNKGFINNLIKAADAQEITQLKHKYSNAFDLCEYLKEPKPNLETLVKLVRDVETPKDISNQQDVLNSMRGLIEAIFSKLNSIGLIPDDIHQNQGHINGSYKFLGGSKSEYIHHDELIHPMIVFQLNYLVENCQDASHNEGNKLRAKSYLSHTKNSYIYQSLIYSLLEVMDYFKTFIDNNSDKVLNISKWSVKEIDKSVITGQIVQDTLNNYSCEGYLLNYTYVEQNGFKEGDTIKITESSENTNPRTSELYDLFASKFKKLV